MELLGNLLRRLREVASSLSLDMTLLSKIERDERKPTKEQLTSFRKFYKEAADEIQTAWLSDKIVKELQDHKLADKALDLAGRQFCAPKPTRT